MRRFLIVVLMVFITMKIQSQTHDRWASLVNWDGVSPWQKYIIYSPRYMGPNALPVPVMGNGSADSLNTLNIEGALHFGKGDITKNVKLSVNYSLVKDVISLDLTWIPAEWFHMLPDLKNERHVYYDSYNDTRAKGDMYLNTCIQLANRWRKQIHLALRIGYRFPTSSSLGSARYTDAPGYYFDVSSAKVLAGNKKWKLTSMLGFYVWQANNFGQNDAFLFGAGVEYNSKNWRWQLNSTGYLGWMHNGDDPVIVSTGVEKRHKNFTLTLNIRQGLRDFIYTSIEAGTKFRIQSLKK